MDIYTSTLIIFRDKYKGQIPLNGCKQMYVYSGLDEYEGSTFYIEIHKYNYNL